MLAIIKHEMDVMICEDYDVKINELLRKINVLECNEDEKFVIDKYYELFKKFNRVPEFFEIYDYLENHNEEIFWGIATIQFYNECKLNEYIDEDAVSQQIDDFAWGWMESCGYSYLDVKLKLEIVLRKYRLCTLFCVDDEIFDIYNPWEYAGVMFAIADCQNTLMDRIIDDNCAGNANYMIYYNPDFKESG